MLSDNLSPNILRPASSQPLSLKLETLTLDAFLLRFTAGQTLPGKVVQVLPQQKAVVEIRGEKLLFQFPRPVLPGQKIAIKIEQIQPTPLLKWAAVSSVGSKMAPGHFGKAAIPLNTQQLDTTSIPTRAADPLLKTPGPDQSAVSGLNKPHTPADIKATSPLLPSELKQLGLQVGQKVRAEILSVLDRETLLVRLNGNAVTLKQTAAHKSQPGEIVILQARLLSVGKFVVDVEPVPASPARFPLELSVLKNYLPARQSLVQIMTGLKEIFLDGPLSPLKKLNIDAGQLKELQANLQKIVARNSKVPDGLQLKELVDRTGFHYEAKVKDFAMDPTLPNKNALLENDLKGQLMRFARQLEQISAGSADSGSNDKFITRLLTQVNQAVTNIELQQLTHHFSKEEQHPLLLQLPENLFGEKDRFKIYILPDQREGSSPDTDSNNRAFNLVFLLNLSVLGDLKIETRILKDDIAIHITGSDSNALRFIQGHIPELQDTFREWGYSVSVISRHEAEVEMEIPDSLGALLVDTPLNMVDIKT